MENDLTTSLLPGDKIHAMHNRLPIVNRVSWKFSQQQLPSRALRFPFFNVKREDQFGN